MKNDILWALCKRYSSLTSGTPPLCQRRIPLNLTHANTKYRCQRICKKSIKFESFSFFPQLKTTVSIRYRCEPFFHVTGLFSAVRYGRVPKRPRMPDKLASGEHGSSTFRKSTKSTSPDSQSHGHSHKTCLTDVAVPLDVTSEEHLAIYHLILTVTQAHNANCLYTDEKIRHLNRHPAILVRTVNGNIEISISNEYEWEIYNFGKKDDINQEFNNEAFRF